MLICVYIVIYILFGTTFKYKKLMSTNMDYVLNICKYMYIKYVY